MKLSRRRKLVASRSESASFAWNRILESASAPRRNEENEKKKVEFSSHTGNLALMRKFVRGFLEAYPFSEKERTLMVLGVDEACTDPARLRLAHDQLISLSLEGIHHGIRLRLRDYGKQTAAQLDEGPTDHLIRPGGLGLHLIRNAFDQVDYVLAGAGRNW